VLNQIKEWKNTINTWVKQKSSPKRIKTPTVLQMEAVECGAASLAIILGYYGSIIPLPELRQACGVSRDGSNASNIIKAAKYYGLMAKGFKKGIETITQVKPPFIVFWNFNHFLVVEGFGKDQVYLNDPATGPRRVSWSEFDDGYTGIILVFQPSPNFVKKGKKSSVIRSLSARLSNSLPAISFCILAGFLLVIPNMALPAFLQVFIDQILIQGRLDWLQNLLIAMLFTVGFKFILSWLRLENLRQLKVKFALSMSSKFVWHILRLPISFYAQRYPGEIVYRTTINDKVADALSGKLATTIIDLVMMVFYIIIMLQYNKILTIIGLFFAVINLVSLQIISRFRADANRILGVENSKAAGVAIAGLQSIETIKASGLESDFFARWVGYYTKALLVQQQLTLQNQFLSLLPLLLSAITKGLILIIGGLQIINGQLTMGMLIAFQTLMESFLEPVNRLVTSGGLLQELEGDLERLDDVLDNPIDSLLTHDSEEETIKYTSKTTITKLEGKIEFKNISFGYSRVESPLIDNFNLIIEPGERIALVGGSGSGKSTIAKLITGLYKPWEGQLYFDDISCTEIPRWVMTNSLAMVEQEILLFAGTIRENLTLWDASIPEIDLVNACQDAAIHDVITSLSGGYESELLEGGANLSGGQRQRLEIARALVYNPTILVMDEATSALDGDTENIVARNIIKRGCTCIIVAHRLSTIRDCDEIIVLEYGKVVERGNHQELLKLNGVYAQLIHSEG
jgi:ATP-binding cassette, subfamily C, bacterial